MSPRKISTKGVQARSPYKIPILYMQCLCTQSLKEVSWQVLYKLPIRGLLAGSVSEISAQALHKRSLGKISKNLCKRPLGKMSEQDLYKSSLY